MSSEEDKSARAYLAAIVASSDDAILSKDLQGIITSWNSAAERIFGYTAAEAIGRPVTLLVPPDRVDEERQILGRIRDGKRIDHFETVRIRKDGTPVDVSVTISPIRDESGKIIGASKIARDITGRKRTEQELAETTHQLRDTQVRLEKHTQDLERTISERTAELRATVGDLEAFSYTISHDLRAPLRAMQGFAHLLRETHGGNLDAEGQLWLDRIVRAAARLNQLIEDVLSYSRVGRGDLKLKPIALEELVPRVIEEYPNVAQANPEITLARPMHAVIGSETLLIQCIANLLGNAVKFVAPGTRPRITVRTEKRNGTVRIWFEDNGIGVREKDRHQIFGLFTRGVNNADVEGTGVGLAVVHRAVTRMHGTVGVESEPGQGSRFWIELPAAE